MPVAPYDDDVYFLLKDVSLQIKDMTDLLAKIDFSLMFLIYILGLYIAFKSAMWIYRSIILRTFKDYFRGGFY